VLGRIVSQLVNEAAFMIGEGLARPEDIDTGATLGLNYPRGPVSWSASAGLDHVRAVLGALHATRGEERYRQAPLLDDERVAL
jgi:3-hydroxybutyryl-CoA dehydrogenase